MCRDLVVVVEELCSIVGQDEDNLGRSCEAVSVLCLGGFGVIYTYLNPRVRGDSSLSVLLGPRQLRGLLCKMDGN